MGELPLLLPVVVVVVVARDDYVAADPVAAAASGVLEDPPVDRPVPFARVGVVVGCTQQTLFD